MEKHKTCSEKPVERHNSLIKEGDLSGYTIGSCPVNFSVAVVLPAAGTGERAGLSTPKQFCKILGRPLISYTIHAFERLSWIHCIVVVVAKENHDMMADILHKYSHTKVKIVEGGSTRHRSIFNGLLAFCEQGLGSGLQKPKVVIIHDAVRPFIEEDFLFKIAHAAYEQGASGAIRPLVSTVVAATEGYLDHALDRASFRASEMPQGFMYDIIYEAYHHCSEAQFNFGTECLDLVLQHCDIRATLIEGPSSLWKVTYKRDLASAEAVIKEFLSESACIITGVCTETQNLCIWMKNSLVAAGMRVDAVPSTERIRTLSTIRNFVKLSVNSPNCVEIGEMIKMCEETKDVLLYPVVIIWVYLDVPDQVSSKEENCESSTILTIAEDAQKRNIFLYCVRLSYSKDSTQWEKAMNRLCQIIMAIIRDRSAALTGQMLHA